MYRISFSSFMSKLTRAFHFWEPWCNYWWTIPLGCIWLCMRFPLYDILDALHALFIEILVEFWKFHISSFNISLYNVVHACDKISGLSGTIGVLSYGRTKIDQFFCLFSIRCTTTVHIIHFFSVSFLFYCTGRCIRAWLFWRILFLHGWVCEICNYSVFWSGQNCWAKFFHSWKRMFMAVLAAWQEKTRRMYEKNITSRGIDSIH